MRLSPFAANAAMITTVAAKLPVPTVNCQFLASRIRAIVHITQVRLRLTTSREVRA
jgi:hypothetical protein